MSKRLAKWKASLIFEYQDTKTAVMEVYLFVRTHNWKQTLRIVTRRKYIPWWILLFFIIGLSVALSSYHNQIVDGMRPYVENIKTSKFAWLIPLILLIIVSFPPLFGHEIITLLCGMIWGLGLGFAIVAGGTFLGELATYVAFKYLFRAKAAKLETKHVIYACIARMMRNGGLPMLVLCRFSALPGHLVTAIQSTIGIGMWMYAVAAFITLPKQFSIVYLGWVYNQTGEQVDPSKKSDKQTGEPLNKYYSSQQTRISLIVFAITTLATLIAAYIVWQKARRIRPQVLADMEERRKAEAEAEAADVPTLDIERTNSRRSVSTAIAMRLSMDNNRIALPLVETQELAIEPASRPQLSRALDSSASLLGSTWSVNDTLGGRSRSSTINSSKAGRTRTNTLSSMGRTPSLPDLTTFFEAQALEEELLQQEQDGRPPENIFRHRRSSTLH